MTPEQESELVAAIKEAFDSDKWFDEASILALAEAYQDITPYHTNRPPSFIR